MWGQEMEWEQVRELGPVVLLRVLETLVVAALLPVVLAQAVEPVSEREKAPQPIRRPQEERTGQLPRVPTQPPAPGTDAGPSRRRSSDNWPGFPLPFESPVPASSFCRSRP